MPRYAFVIESAGGTDVQYREFADDKAAEEFARNAGKRTQVTVMCNKETIAIFRNP